MLSTERHTSPSHCIHSTALPFYLWKYPSGYPGGTVGNTNRGKSKSLCKTMLFDKPDGPVESRTFVYEFRHSKPCVCPPEDEGPSSSRSVEQLGTQWRRGIWCMITVSLGCPPMTLETNDEVEKITYLHIPSQLSGITAANDDQPILSFFPVYR